MSHWLMEAIYLGTIFSFIVIGIIAEMELYLTLLMVLMVIGMKIEYNQWSLNYETHH